MKNNLKKNFTNALILIISVATIGIAYLLISFDIFPGKYLYPVLGALALITILIIVWLKKSKGKASRIVAFLLVILIVFGYSQISMIKSLFSKLSGDSQTHIVNVIVMEDSDYESIDDVKDFAFGVNLAQDGKNINKTIEAIKDEEGIDVDTEEYNNYIDLTDSLYYGDLEVIIMSEAHAVFLEEEKPDFEDETRIIATYEFTEIVENTSRDIDVTKDTYSVFITGIDTFGSISAVSRSDVNMVMTVNPTTNQILLTSIPRDYYVQLHTPQAYDKLTHAGIYGVEESMRTLEDLLSSQVEEDIYIDHFLRVNFTSAMNVVDALGGVEIYSQYEFKSGAGPYFYQGMNYMNGEQALAFVRERYNLPNGDYDRIKNQQAFLTGVLNKAMSPAIITNYGNFLNSIGEGMELSFSDSELNRTIKKQLDTMEGWDIVQIQLQGSGSNSTNTYSMPGYNLYVVEPNYESVQSAAKLILAMENGATISSDDYLNNLGNE